MPEISYPKSKQTRSRFERGDVTLPLVILLSVIGVIGVGYAIERSTNESKNAKLNELRGQSNLAPLNAAIVAKALMSAPVITKWTTADFVADGKFLPNVYPDPYVSSSAVLNGSASQADLAILNPPAAGAIWSNSQFASGIITVRTSDSNQILASSLNSIFAAASSGSFNLSNFLPTVDSSIRYSLKNCDTNGVDSASWTGYYCADADITSQTPVQTGSSPRTVNSKLRLGVIPPPPPPICAYDSSPVTISRGQSVRIPVNATGVVTGFTFKATRSSGGTSLSLINVDEPKIYTPANQIAVQKVMGVFTFDSSVYTAAQLPIGSQVLLEFSLKNVSGTTTCATKTITIQGSVSCSVGFYDRNNYSTPELGGAITAAHENSNLFAKVDTSGLMAGDELRLALTAMTLVDSAYSLGPNGVVLPATNGSQLVQLTAQGDSNMNYLAKGRIYRGGSMIYECPSPTQQLQGKWLDAPPGTTSCSTVCAANSPTPLVPTFDKGGMTCMSGENYFNPAYVSRRTGTNNPGNYLTLDSMKTGLSSVGFPWSGGATGDFEKTRVDYPTLNKKTLSANSWCYWTNGNIMNFGGCTAGNNDSLTINACQVFDEDPEDKVRACYCGLIFAGP